MSNKNVFSTPREQKMTGEQMLESIIKKRQNQRRNMMALTEANKIINDNHDFTATMEANNASIEAEIKQNSLLENAYYKQASKNLAKKQLGMRSTLIQEGMDYVRGKIIGEIIYEAYWLDDPVKESTIEQIEESVSNVLNYIEENCKKSKVTENNHSKFLKNLDLVVESIVKEAVERIVKEATENNDAFAEFDLTDAEQDKLDDKLVDLGRDEIVDLIRDKVAHVVQDEKERGKEKAKMFKELDDMTSDDELGDEPDDSSKDDIGESTIATGNNAIKYTLESALKIVPTNTGFSNNEKYIANIMENGAEFNCFEDPSWGEFKSCVSMMVKKIKCILDKASMSKDCSLYNAASCIIQELSKKLESVPEGIPDNVKEFVMGIVGMLYGSVPSDEVIISRFGSFMGSPNLTNPAVDYATTSWIDLLVNLKTNLASIKNYCDEKADSPCYEEPIEITNGPNPSLNGVIKITQNRVLNRNIGGSLFEAMMIGTLAECSNVAMESASNLDESNIEDAALIETLLNYTVLETLDTLGIYKFGLSDVTNIKKAFMSTVTEGASPLTKSDSVTGNTPKQVMGLGKDSTGKKKIRINTRKMRKNNFEKNT